jgi:hypothetical protein
MVGTPTPFAAPTCVEDTEFHERREQERGRRHPDGQDNYRS